MQPRPLQIAINPSAGILRVILDYSGDDSVAFVASAAFAAF
jgi:hypothetical protein